MVDFVDICNTNNISESFETGAVTWAYGKVNYSVRRSSSNTGMDNTRVHVVCIRNTVYKKHSVSFIFMFLRKIVDKDSIDMIAVINESSCAL